MRILKKEIIPCGQKKAAWDFKSRKTAVSCGFFALFYQIVLYAPGLSGIEVLKTSTVFCINIVFIVLLRHNNTRNNLEKRLHIVTLGYFVKMYFFQPPFLKYIVTHILRFFMNG